MKKQLIAALLVLTFLSTPAFAGKFSQNDTPLGQFTDLVIRGTDDSAVSGNEATIDVRQLKQGSATGAIPVLSLEQSDTDEAILAVVCDSSVSSSCTCYATTQSTKAGTIEIKVNGQTRYLNFYNAPD